MLDTLFCCIYSCSKVNRKLRRAKAPTYNCSNIGAVVCAGEQVITHAENALRFAPYSDRKQGISGNLFVTNFKVSFVTADKSSYTYKEVSLS